MEKCDFWRPMKTHIQAVLNHIDHYRAMLYEGHVRHFHFNFTSFSSICSSRLSFARGILDSTMPKSIGRSVGRLVAQHVGLLVNLFLHLSRGFQSVPLWFRTAWFSGSGTSKNTYSLKLWRQGVREPANKLAQRIATVKQAEQSRQMSERCEEMSKHASKWPSAYFVLIHTNSHIRLYLLSLCIS